MKGRRKRVRSELEDMTIAIIRARIEDRRRTSARIVIEIVPDGYRQWWEIIELHTESMHDANAKDRRRRKG